MDDYRIDIVNCRDEKVYGGGAGDEDWAVNAMVMRESHFDIFRSDGRNWLKEVAPAGNFQCGEIQDRQGQAYKG